MRIPRHLDSNLGDGRNRKYVTVQRKKERWRIEPTAILKATPHLIGLYFARFPLIVNKRTSLEHNTCTGVETVGIGGGGGLSGEADSRSLS